MSLNDDNEKVITIAASTLILGCAIEQLDEKEKWQRNRKKRKCWVKDWLACRESMGAYHALVLEFSLNEHDEYHRFMRMDPETFKDLVERLIPYVQKQRTVMRAPISVEEKVACTLRYLATGESFTSLSFLFRIHRSTISRFIPEVCFYIFKVLKGDFCKIPASEDEWIKLANDSFEQWNFPNSIAAIDGKHIAIKNPVDGASEFYNYKSFHSIVLLGIFSHDYRFLSYDIGCQGRISDGGVWAHSNFCKKLKNGKLNIPKPRPLPVPADQSWENFGKDRDLPFVLVGDSAFPLTKNMMKPYPEKKLDDRKRIFNYRLSRKRRVSENGFGIWANRFRIFHTTIDLHPDLVVVIVNATIALHNMLCMKSRESYIPHGFSDHISENGEVIDGDWRDEDQLLPLQPLVNGNNCTKDANDVREKFADYFCGPGQVEWQWKILL